MEVIGINEGIYCWIVFWLTYWLFGGFLSYLSHRSNIRSVNNLNKVIFTLFHNMIWTFFGTILITQIPLRMMTTAHIMIKFILTYFITETWFYHIHIMMHQRQLYWSHKTHHEFCKPYGLTALYCSPYEAIILNTCSVALPMVILQLDPFYAYLWVSLSAFDSVLSHSGYSIPYIISDYHDMHHRYFSCNYGISRFFDNIYGTSFIEPDKIIDIGKESITHLGNFKIDLDLISNIFQETKEIK